MASLLIITARNIYKKDGEKIVVYVVVNFFSWFTFYGLWAW